MAAVLAISDTADGTGGVATVSGSNASSSNKVYSAPFTGVMGAHTWTLAGTRTGDGTITLASPSPIALGFYLWRLDSLLSGVTEVATVYQALSTSATAVHKQCIDAVVTRINSLGLSGLASTELLPQWLQRLRAGQHTGKKIIVCPYSTESFPGVLTSTDDVGYPVAVVLVAPANDDEVKDFNKYLLYRQKIERAISFQRLAGVTKVLYGQPMPGPILVDAAFEKQYIVSVLGFRFVARLERGLT